MNPSEFYQKLGTLLCDQTHCSKMPKWHVEDEGDPRETNAVSCSDHVGYLCAPMRKSVVQQITADNISEIIAKR
jgi:hypothetical protein